ncbi:RNA polymerase sigma factor [Salinactinospora qingdaonensis]|uniref:DNA-directed RNA polymerase specialized sigma subunit, sigma24 family n=1 Tax=Salinactinospora qingdaonensis TaxID=702744 RepID=A0ABP7G7W4_9ACTN
MTARPEPGGGSSPPTDTEFAVLVSEGRGYEEWYDAFAPGVYRYCWTLIGAGSHEHRDGAGAAACETFLAAVTLIDRLQDRSLLRPWLFSLARTACQNRGFAPHSPYGELVVADEERLAVSTLLQLPPSYRELLELYLRQELTPSQIGLILGFAPETASELCRAALRRVVDLLSERMARPDRPGASQWTLMDVTELLATVNPPDPPAGCRVETLAGCRLAELADERARAAEIVAPLGADGFPLHCERGAGATLLAGEGLLAEETDKGATREAEETQTLPRDRLTTADVPLVNAAEPVAEVGGGEGGGDEEHVRWGRWLTPALAGLATAIVALGLWVLGSTMAGGPAIRIAGSPPPDPVATAPASPSPSTASLTTEISPSEPPTDVETASVAEASSLPTPRPQSSAGGSPERAGHPTPEDSTVAAAPTSQQSATPSTAASTGGDLGDDSPEPASPSPSASEADRHDGPIRGLFGGILDLFQDD